MEFMGSLPSQQLSSSFRRNLSHGITSRVFGIFPSNESNVSNAFGEQNGSEEMGSTYVVSFLLLAI